MSAHRDCCSRPRDFGQMLCSEHIASFWCFRYDKQGNSPVGGKIDLVIQLRGAAEIDFQKERRNDETKTAISCSNTMMMAINERRTEVGILKVLGSELRDIATMFLTEAAMIGLLGGLVGIGLSFALRAALNGMLSEMDVRSVMPVWLAGFALAFSVVIAVISALIPAMNAMRISPLCAMRDE